MNTQAKMELATARARNLTLAGYFGLLILIPVWIWYLSPPELLSKEATTILWWLPALMPLRGIILNRPFTFAWSGFLAVFYISQAITTLIATDNEQYLAMFELILASCWFAGAAMFSRWRGEELGLQLPKRKKSKS